MRTPASHACGWRRTALEEAAARAAPWGWVWGQTVGMKSGAEGPGFTKGIELSPTE